MPFGMAEESKDKWKNRELVRSFIHIHTTTHTGAFYLWAWWKR